MRCISVHGIWRSKGGDGDDDITGNSRFKRMFFFPGPTRPVRVMGYDILLGTSLDYQSRKE